MRATLAAAILAAAITPLSIGALPTWAQTSATPPAQPAAPAAATSVPVKRVVLYTSGVGYFEHYGTIHGDGNTVLSFKTDQINDVLKSLLLEDLDGGRVTSVSYPTLAPLSQTLRSFQVDLSTDPTLADILKQLRGAQVTAVTPTGPIDGEVLGVEQKTRQVGTGPDAKAVDQWVVNLLNGSGIQPVDLDKVTELKLADPELAGEMQKALAAVALSRDKDKKPVAIGFSGKGDHRVRIGYVVETPIWKASYRISLGDANGPAAPPAAGDQPGPAPGAGAANIPADQKGHIQGWAIVDNQTDNDWEGVELALVSGRPISFMEDLYQPLYVPRPTVQPDLFAGLMPRTYDEGNAAFGGADGMGGGGGGGGDRMEDKFRDADNKQLEKGAMQERQAMAGDAPEAASMQMAQALTTIQPQASGGKVGEAFEYTVHDVSLARQKSSMIPILSGPMRTQRVSIYNQSVLPNNPLLGTRLTNTSGGYIMQGPVTVLDGGVYAGDAQILDIPPNQQRLISYGVDQRMQVNTNDARQNTQLLTAKIDKGVLELSNQEVFDQTYLAASKADNDKLLVVEHPRHIGWDLVTPKTAAETTDTLYRFEVSVPAGKTASLAVEERHVFWQGMQILPTDLTTLVVYSQNAAIPQPVKDALVKAIQLRQSELDSERDLAQVRADKAELSAEQDRMRENMKVVSPGTDYYKKLLQKLDDQETQFEQMETHEKQLVQQQKDRQAQLENYLSSLTVG